MPCSVPRHIKRLTYRLPGYGPVVAILPVPYIDIVTGPVHRNCIATKSCDPVIFRRIIKKISACSMINYSAHIFHSQIVGPRYRKINSFYNVLIVISVKMPVSHILSPLFTKYSFCYLKCKITDIKKNVYSWLFEIQMPRIDILILPDTNILIRIW